MYGLTTTGRFLVGERNLSPMVPFLMSPLVVSSFFSMCDWLRCEPAVARSPFELAHGCPQWEMASKDALLNRILNDSMVADSQLSLEVIILDRGYIFHGLSSLVDVGGGHGAAAQVIANAFPRIKCTVLDLPHVIDQGTTHDYGNLRFVAGDMFESIPPADAVLLKVCIDITSSIYNYSMLIAYQLYIPFHPHNYDIVIKINTKWPHQSLFQYNYNITKIFHLCFLLHTAAWSCGNQVPPFWHCKVYISNKT
jgi:hypothetical protein